MKIRRVILGLTPLACLLLAGCVSWEPKALGPDDLMVKTREATQEQRRVIYDYYRVSRVWDGECRVQGVDWGSGSLKRYMDQSGDTVSAQMVGLGNSVADITGVLAWMVSSLVIGGGDYYQQPGNLLYGLGVGGLSVGLDELFLEPNREKAAQSFNQGLWSRLCLEGVPPKEPFFGLDDPSALYFFLCLGSRGISNSDVKTYFNNPGWDEDRLDWVNRSSGGLGWISRQGWGAELGYEADNQGYHTIYTNKATQTTPLLSQSVFLSPGYTFLLLAKSKITLTASLDLGWCWLNGENILSDASGATLGYEHLSGKGFCVGPRFHLRRVVGSAFSWGFEGGYHFGPRYFAASDSSYGTLYGATPGKNWNGQPEVWDFSGWQLGVVMEFGAMPYTR